MKSVQMENIKKSSFQAPAKPAAEEALNFFDLCNVRVFLLHLLLCLLPDPSHCEEGELDKIIFGQQILVR